MKLRGDNIFSASFGGIGQGLGYGNLLEDVVAGASLPPSIAGTTLEMYISPDSQVYSDAGVTPIADTEAIYQVNDLSGNGIIADQSVGSEQLVYSADVFGAGLNGFRKSGTDNMELDTTLSFGSAEDYIVFSVFKRSDSGNNGIIGSHIGNNSSILDWASGTVYYFTTAGTYVNVATSWSTNLVVRAYRIDESDTGTMYIYENGTEIATKAITIGGGANFDRIFNRNNKDGTGVTDFGDLAVYRGAFTPTDVTTVTDYFKTKYGIV